MPSYNSLGTLDESIRSVLAQTDTDYELIVIDDCSTDDVTSIYARYSEHPKIKILHSRSNVGPGMCRNLGLASSSGRYVHFLDSDDLMLPTLLETLREAHEATRAHLCCSSYLRYGQFRGLFPYASLVVPPGLINQRVLRRYNPLPILSTSIDRSRVSIPLFVGRKDIEKLSRPEDYIFWRDLFDCNPRIIVHTVQAFLACYRVSRVSRSANKFATFNRIYELNLGLATVFSPSAFLSAMIFGFYSIKSKSFWEIADIILPPGILERSGHR